MENENLENQSVEEVDEIDAIGALKAEIADLKANTVSKSQYNKLKKVFVGLQFIKRTRTDKNVNYLNKLRRLN